MLKQRSLSKSVVDAPGLLEKISDHIETFVTNVRRGKLGAHDGKSLSTTAAIETVRLMRTIVSLFRESEEARGGAGNQMLRANRPADEVATALVRHLMQLVSRAGEAVLRAQFSTLLLTNVTRRILSLIRDAAAHTAASASELEALAVRRLNELDERGGSSEEDDEDEAAKPQWRAVAAMPQPCRGAGPSPTGGADDGATRQRLRKDLSVRFDISDMADAQHRDAAQSADILTAGIPGKQTLRRAPSCREDDGSRAAEFPVRLLDFFDNVVDRIDAFQAEIEGMCEELCRRASKQLHASDTVITIGCSHTTRQYLLRGAQESLRSGVGFKVIILDGAPFPAAATQSLASELRNMMVNAQVLPDSSVFAVMGTCTKALVGAEGVLANGGLLAPIGTHPLCIAAKHFAVPVLVVTTTLKMSMYYPRDALCTSLVKISRSSAQEIPWNTYGSSGDVLPTPCGEKTENIGSLVVHSPVTEYVPPELVTLYATNESEYMPSQIHRIVRENYNPED